MTAASGFARRLARWRVTAGFVLGAVVLWLAEPTWRSIAVGAAIALVGEALRLWAAGHLEKSREVTRSGPYRWTRHPLYAGSAIIAAGLAVASGSLPVAAIVASYVLTTIPAAIVSEEAHLNEKFQGEYDRYKSSHAPPMERRFSLARARFNREHHTIAGVCIGLALLAVKTLM
jgi:protein-S-isoprenylcysteine O-methyltransferase Ste14